jgi:hypothetical protein
MSCSIETPSILQARQLEYPLDHKLIRCNIVDEALRQTATQRGI